jgi:hypothetical protein
MHSPQQQQQQLQMPTAAQDQQPEDQGDNQGDLLLLDSLESEGQYLAPATDAAQTAELERLAAGLQEQPQQQSQQQSQQQQSGMNVDGPAAAAAAGAMMAEAASPVLLATAPSGAAGGEGVPQLGEAQLLHATEP